MIASNFHIKEARACHNLETHTYLAGASSDQQGGMFWGENLHCTARMIFPANDPRVISTALFLYVGSMPFAAWAP